MKKTLTILGATVLITLTVFIAGNDLSLLKSRHEAPSALLSAINQECKGVITAGKFYHSIEQQNTHFYCGDKELLINVEKQYASWSFKDEARKPNVIYMLVKEDVLPYFNAAASLWKQKPEQNQVNTLARLEELAYEVTKDSLKEMKSIEVSKFLTFGVEQRSIFRTAPYNHPTYHLAVSKYYKNIGDCRESFAKDSVYCQYAKRLKDTENYTVDLSLFK